MAKLSWLIAIAFYASAGDAFSVSSPPKSHPSCLQVQCSSNHESVTPRTPSDANSSIRRALLANILTTPLFFTQTAQAASIPSVSSEEFDSILRTSSKSISLVQLSGPKSETCLVTLVDGTTFSISDLVESPTDPRSPLKLVARCRLYNVPVKNVGLLSALGVIDSDSSVKIGESGKKKKNYSNERVRIAEEKEKEKRARMEEDERERLEELYRLQGEVGGVLSD